MCERLSSFGRLILFDKRGTGLSDRDVGFPTLEQRMDDVRAVMDAAGSERAALFGHSEGGNMSILFAATYPERTLALVLFGTFARRLWAPDYPWGATPEDRVGWVDSMEREWREGVDVGRFAPGRANDQSFAAWLTAYCRNSASPGTAKMLAQLNSEIDIRGILPAVRVPTLVLHRVDDQNVKIEEGRYLAERIPDAKFVDLPGSEHTLFASPADDFIEEIEEFLTGARHAPEAQRVLETLLFTDIVGSTDIAARLGDAAWRELLSQHDKNVRHVLERFRGREVKTTGDGFLAAFDGPARAIQAARGIKGALRLLKIDIRASIHTGECELRGEELSGIAIHLASRILGEAGDGEILVSNTVKDLVVGSGIEFIRRGEASLRGIPGTWQLFLVDEAAAS
jgi:pimeloyl-ACP methyl ester carboxylesterase/class 3 adenylate cyclase